MLGTNTLRLQHVLFAVLVVAAAAVWPLYFVDLFPLSEARDWLGWSGNDDIVRQRARNLLYRETRFSRDFSMLMMFGIGRVCDSSIRCVNVLAALPLVLSSLALYSLISILSGRAAIAAVASATWSLSLPFLSTAAWQATIHDRVGMLCTLCAMSLAWRFRPDVAAWKLVSYSAAIAGLTVAALNSKEAYWFLPPAIVLCHGLRAANSQARRFLAHDLLVLLPMLAYSVWFVIRYVGASEFAADWSQHVGSGGVVSNLVACAGYSFGGFAGLLLLAILVLTLIARNWRVVDGTSRSKIIWCALTCLLAFLPIARTRFAAPYYTLAPLALFLALIALVFGLASPDKRRSSRYAALLMMIVVAVGMTIALISSSANMHRERVSLSKNFLVAIAARENLAREAVDHKGLCLLTDPKQAQSYLFTDSHFAWDVLRWTAKSEVPPEIRSVPVRGSLHGDCAPLQFDASLRLK